MSPTEGLEMSTFSSLMKYIHYKVMVCKRIENRRWVSLPVKHKCVLVVNTMEGRILHKVYGIEQVDDVCIYFEEELGKDCCIRQIALIVDCYNYSDKFVGRIAIDISGDLRSKQSFLGVSIDSDVLKVKELNTSEENYTLNQGYTIENSSMNAENFPEFYADGGEILS